MFCIYKCYIKVVLIVCLVYCYCCFLIFKCSLIIDVFEEVRLFDLSFYNVDI